MAIIYHQPPNTDLSNDNIGENWLPELGTDEQGYDRIPQKKCGTCFACCEGESSPGWFGPGEVEKAAEYLGMAPEEFVDDYCVVDWIAVADPDVPDHARVVQAFTPVRVDEEGAPVSPTGQRVAAQYPLVKSDRCIFLNREADRSKGESPCQIYPARPLECRKYHCMNDEEDNPKKATTAGLWMATADMRRIPLKAFNECVVGPSRLLDVDIVASEMEDENDSDS